MLSDNIVSLNPRNPVHVEAASTLHASLLPDSPVAKLGPLFMRNFYYSKLIEDRLLACDLYQHDGKYVGFISYTKYPFTFVQQGKQRHFFYLLFVLLFSFLRKPSRLFILFRVVMLGHRRSMKKSIGDIGEILSFGVLEKYRKVSDGVSNLRIPHLLFKNVLEFFQNENFNRVQVSIKKNNDRALQFYLKYASVVEENNFDEKGQYLVTVHFKPYPL